MKLPSLASTPPIRGATNFSIAPSASNAFFSAWTSAMSTPSLTSAPTLRPLKLSGPFRTMLSAGDGSRSMRVGRAASAGVEDQKGTKGAEMQVGEIDDEALAVAVEDITDRWEEHQSEPKSLMHIC